MIVSLLDLKKVEYAAYCHSYKPKPAIIFHSNISCITSLVKCKYYVTQYIKSETYKNPKKQMNGRFSMTNYIAMLYFSYQSLR